MNTNEIAAVFKALGDPSRVAMLQRLIAGPSTAGQLAGLFDEISRPAVSQHLKVLRDAGLVRATTTGRNVWYEVSGRGLLEAEAWLKSTAERWTSAPVLTTPIAMRQGSATKVRGGKR